MDLVDAVNERMLKHYLDIILLAKIKDAEMTGYEMSALLHDQLDSTISSSTIYSTLYSLERRGYVEATEIDKHRTYKLTEKGKENLTKLLLSLDELCNNFKRLLTE